MLLIDFCGSWQRQPSCSGYDFLKGIKWKLIILCKTALFCLLVISMLWFFSALEWFCHQHILVMSQLNVIYLSCLSVFLTGKNVGGRVIITQYFSCNGLSFSCFEQCFHLSFCPLLFPICSLHMIYVYKSLLLLIVPATKSLLLSLKFEIIYCTLITWDMPHLTFVL